MILIAKNPKLPIAKELTVKEKKRINLIHRKDFLNKNYSKKELINQVKRKIPIRSSMTKKEIIDKIIKKENW